MIRFARASIRIRLAVGSAVVAAVLLSTVSVLIAEQVERAAVAAASQLALDDLRPYIVDLHRNPDEEPDPTAAGLLVLVQAPDSSVRRDSMPAALARAARGVADEADTTVAAGRFRIVGQTVRTDAGVWHLWAARDLTASDALLNGVVMTMAISTPVAVLITAVAAWLVAGGALRPVQRMRATAERLRSPDATGTLPVRGGGELAELAVTMNGLIEDLRDSVTHERRVTADAAHELRTPLAVLSAQVELAQRRPAEADLPAIRSSVDRLGRMTDDLLALSRAEGTAAEPVGATSVAELVTEAMAAVDRFRLIAAPGLLVDLALGDDLDETAVAAIDAPGFDRVLANLIGNALAAGPASGVLIRLRTQAGVLELEVADDGPGLPEAFLPYAFDRFSRAEGPRGDRAGAGLGLALVKRLAERGGGSVALQNGDAAGAIATVRIPLVQVGAEPRRAG